MGLAEIQKRILETAQNEAEEMLTKAKNEAAAIVKEGEQKAQARYDELIEEARQKARLIKQGLLTPARLEAKKLILSEKQKLMDQVFKGVDHKVREEKEIEVAKVLYG